MIVVDVWGGEGSQNHLARFLLPINEALIMTRNELKMGNLVNLRKEIAWGSYKNFDNRLTVEETA